MHQRWLREAVLPVIYGLQRSVKDYNESMVEIMFFSRLGNTWKYVGENSERIKIIFSIVIAFYVLWEYKTKEHETRVSRALDRITAATSHDILMARVATELFAAKPPLSDNLSKDKLWNGVSCDNVSFSKCNPNAETMKEIDKIVTDDATIRAYVHSLMNVYYDVATCGISEQCDPLTICRAFFPEISGYYTKYRGYLQPFNEKWNIGKLDQIGKFIDMCTSRSEWIE